MRCGRARSHIDNQPGVRGYLAVAQVTASWGGRLNGTMVRREAVAHSRSSVALARPIWRRPLMSRKKRSTMFSQDAEVGVKCTLKRGCLASHCATPGCLCVA
jgi:hypothetical protein